MGFSRKIRSLVLLFGIALCLGTFAASAEETKPPPSLEELEKVTAKAKGLDDFLARPELQEEYFLRLGDYYGEEKFPREAYDAILKQLRELRQKVPEIAERLWAGTNLGDTFALKVPVQSSGFELKPQQWKEYLKNTEEALRERMGSWNAISEDERARRLQEIVQKLSQRIEEFEANQKNLTRLERIAPAKKFYAEFAADIADAREAGAYWQLEELRKERFLDPFHSNDADLVLEAWKKFREGHGFTLEDKEILGAVRKVLLPEPLPDLTKPPLEVITDPKTKVRAAAETEIFRTKVKQSRKGIIPEGVTSSGKIDFKVLPRRFHGIWKGIPLNECVGGSCQSLNALSPERWASIALDNSRLYQVEQNGIYLGFVQIVPVKKDGRIYGSIEFGAPILAKRIIQEEKGRQKPESLSRKLVAELKKHIPVAWSGMILGQSVAINNAGVQQSVRASPAFAAGTPLREGAAEHIDPLAKKIVEASPRDGFAHAYGGNMIVDATVKGQTGLRVLRPHLENKDFSRQSTGTYLTRILQSPDPMAASRVLDTLHGLGNKVKLTIQAEEIAALANAIDSANERVAERALGLIRVAKQKAFAPGAEPKLLETLLEKLAGPAANNAPSLQALTMMLPQASEALSPAELEKVALLALRRKHQGLLEILYAKKAFNSAPLSLETKAALVDFFLDPASSQGYHFQAESIVRHQLQGDPEAVRMLADKLEEIGRPLKVNEANLVLKLSEQPGLLSRAESDKLKLMLVERVPIEDVLRANGLDFEPMMYALDEVLPKISKERLVELALPEYWVHPGVTSAKTTYKMQDRVYRRIAQILQQDEPWHIRRLVEMYENAADREFFPYPSFEAEREKLIEKRIQKMASTITFHKMDDEAERLVRAAIPRRKSGRNDTQFMINVLHVNLYSARRSFREPATFDALLTAAIDIKDGKSWVYDTEKSFGQEAKIRYLEKADSNALKGYFKTFSEDISEPWAQKVLFSPKTDPEAFAWAHFEGFGKNLKQLTPEVWEVLRHRLMDPDSKVHARTAYFLLESELAWPDGLLSDYIKRVISEVPTFENRFGFIWLVTKLNEREGFQNPLWEKLKKYRINYLIESVYSNSNKFFNALERDRTIRLALESGDPELIRAVQAAYRASIQSGQAPAYWNDLIGADAKVLVQPVHPWSCAGMYGRLKRTVGL